MADYAQGVNLDTPIPTTAPAMAWRAAVALGAAEGAPPDDPDRLAVVLGIVGLDLDEIRAGKEEVKR